MKFVFNGQKDWSNVPLSIRRTNKTVDHSDEVGASPVGAAPKYIFILNLTPGFNGLIQDNCKTRRDEKHFVLGLDAPYIREFTVFHQTNLKPFAAAFLWQHRCEHAKA